MFLKSQASINFLAHEKMEFNIATMRSFPKGNLDEVEGATKWRPERNRIVAVISSDLRAKRSGEDVRVFELLVLLGAVVVFSYNF